MNRIKTLENYLKQTPEDPFLQYALALEYVSNGNTPEAIQLFSNLIKARPDYSATYYHYARLLAEAGAISEAVTTIKLGIEITQTEGNRHAENELRLLMDELEDDN